MILEYHRPQALDQALALLSRETPPTIPLGGGTVISQMGGAGVAVVDLQALGLNTLAAQGNALVAGATVTLEQLYQHPDLPAALKEAIRLEATLNLRNVASVAGAVVAGDGLSPYLTVLLALDARLLWQPGDEAMTIGDYLALKHTLRPGRLMTQISLLLQPKVQFAAVGRSPLDRPMLSVAVARWPSGRTRVAVGGEAPAPVLALDGFEAGGIEGVVSNACAHFSNQWSSQAYRNATIQTLVKRLTQSQEETR
jgi:CO/xanthine dehydrogenase FAD-binding subunit